MAGTWVNAYVTEAEYRQVLALAKKFRVTPGAVVGAFVPVVLDLAENKPDVFRKMVYEGVPANRRVNGV